MPSEQASSVVHTLPRAELSDEAFQWLIQTARARWGLHITEKKRTLVENRMMSLGRRRRLGSSEEVVASYRARLGPLTDLEIFDVLSTNLTSFFRDPAHYDLLATRVVKPWQAGGAGKLAIWSAGCSKGCEPYSIAMRVHDEVHDHRIHDVRILATDYASSVLHEARQGTYEASMAEGLPLETLRTHFLRGRGVNSGRIKVRRRVKALVKFDMLNLIDPWQMKSRYDAIFCRNVMIYFDTSTQEALIQKFAHALKPGGMFFLGSSENISNGIGGLEPIGNSAYRKARAKP